MTAPLAQLLQGLRDVVFPPVCLECGGLVEDGDLRHICLRCAPRIFFVRDPHCLTCGHPFFGQVEGERICPHCDGLKPLYREGRTCVLFKGPARHLVHELKYNRGLHVLADIETIVRRHDDILDYLRGKVLVPVPLHATKERARGYNQSRLIAEVLVRAAAGEARIDPLLQRVRDTGSQTRLDRKARRANLKNAFAPAPGAAINPDLAYLLVDDVFTTGSTLNACAGTLRRHGCLNLDVLTFGHG
ncbi:MAG: double zinc ribbon domain-containing protein [Verrucomicrobiota bacterium]